MYQMSQVADFAQWLDLILMWVQALLIREIAGFFHDYLDIFRTSILCALTTVCNLPPSSRKTFESWTDR